MSDARPVGVFDSGIGGLTVLSALCCRLPEERFVYLGDTARLPYGTKSTETVTRYALRAAQFLASEGIKMLVVACNTASAAALPTLERELPIPVIGVVEPGARAAVAWSRGPIGLIGTESTVASGAYHRAVRALGGSLVCARACPLFVPLAEEGWFDHPVTHEVASIYLEEFRGGAVDTVILGCTHYPLLKSAIAGAVGREVHLVDSAVAVAEEVAGRLLADGIAAHTGDGQVRLLVTDAPARIARIAALILGDDTPPLQLVDLPA